MSNAVVIFVALVCAIVFTHFNLSVSSKIGRLSTVSNYDDVIYLNKATDIYMTFKEMGVIPGLKLMFTKSLHAPFTVFDAVAGFATFGFDPEHVYYAQIIVLLTYLFFVCWFTRNLDFILRISIIIASLAIPYAALCVLVLRPDQMSGVLVGGITIAILTSEKIFNRARTGIYVGSLLGLSLLVKSSIFALILLVVCGSWVFVSLRELLLKKATFKAIVTSTVLMFLSTIFVAGWYWIQHGKELWNYFMENSFGANIDVWKLPGGVREHLCFYFKGDTLQASLGLFVIPVAVLFLAGCLYDLFAAKELNRKIIGAQLLGMLGCIFIIYYLQGIKNQYMGAILYMYLFYGAVVYFARILSVATGFTSGKPMLKCFMGVFITAVAWCLYQYPNSERVNSLMAENSKSTTLRLLGDLSRDIKSRSASILYTQGGPVVPEYASMILRSQSKKLSFDDALMIKNMAGVIQLLPSYDYVVVQDPEIVGRPGFPMPAEVWEKDLKCYLDQKPEWALLAAYPTFDGKKIYLYRKNHSIKTSAALMPMPAG